jgi:hypothetical protein
MLLPHSSGVGCGSFATLAANVMRLIARVSMAAFTGE